MDCLNNTNKKTIILAMDAYLPYVDGVVNVVRYNSINLIDYVNPVVVVPAVKNYIDFDPYKIIRFKSIRIPIFNFYLGVLKFDSKTKKKLYKMPIDLIHLHSPFGVAKFFLKLSKKRNIPIVATYHTNFSYIFKKIIKIPIISFIILNSIKKVYRKVDEIFVANEKIKELVEKTIARNKFKIIPFGTNFEKNNDITTLKNIANKKYQLSENEFILIYVGRLEKSKRLIFCLKILKKLKKKIDCKTFSQFKFFICGDGLYKNKLKKITTKYKLKNSVIFTNKLSSDELKEIYARSNLLLFPSVFDTFGLVKMEAAIFNTPGLFVKNSNISYNCVDKQNSLLADNKIDSFVEQILWAIKNKEKLNEIGKNAATDFYVNWKTAIQENVYEYERIINAKKDILKNKNYFS